MVRQPRVMEMEHFERRTPFLAAPAATGNTCCYGAAFTDGERCTCWTPALEPVPTTEVQEGPMAVNENRCHDCAYRRDSPERQLRNGKAMPYIPGGTFVCHVGLPRAVAFTHPCGETRTVPAGTEFDDYRPIDHGHQAWQADGRPAVVCAGWAADHAAYEANAHG